MDWAFEHPGHSSAIVAVTDFLFATLVIVTDLPHRAFENVALSVLTVIPCSQSLWFDLPLTYCGDQITVLVDLPTRASSTALEEKSCSTK
jgi:hypothetical protein